MTRSRARLPLTLLLLVVLGCKADRVGPGLVTRRDEPHAARTVDAGPSALAPEPVDVAGKIVSDLPDGAAGRDVVVLDSNLQAWRCVSDQAGRFFVGHVAAPYDVAVLPRADFPAMVYLGIGRGDPTLDLYDRPSSAGTEASPSRTLHFGLSLGKSPCVAADGWVTVATTSAFAYGTSVVACARGQRQMRVDVEHVGAGALSDAALDVHVLVEDPSGASFAYARRSTTTDGIENLEPVPIGTIASVDVAATGETALLPDWRWMTALSLEVGDATLLYAVSAGHEARWALPAIAGSSVQASVIGVHPRGEDASPFHRSTEAWSGTTPLGSSPIDVAIVTGPDLVRPSEGEEIRATELAFEWQTPAITTVFLSLWDVEKARVAYRVVTAERAVPRDRLALLGVDDLANGDHFLELSASLGTSTDDVTSPDEAVRTRPFDRRHPGAETFLRIPFSIVE